MVASNREIAWTLLVIGGLATVCTIGFWNRKPAMKKDENLPVAQKQIPLSTIPKYRDYWTEYVEACQDIDATDPKEDEPIPITGSKRHEFAQRMAQVKKGTSQKEVLEILGKPDDIRTLTDPGGIVTYRTKEIWGYGTNGHLGFPTLGCICIDEEGKTQYVFGGNGEPPHPKKMSEEELVSLLRLIDEAPSYNSGSSYNPLSVIQIANSLQPLGKDKALTAIEEYLRVSSPYHRSGREGVFLILRVLFEIPSGPGYMPPMAVGAPIPKPPKDYKLLPHFPLLIQDDVPFLLVDGYNLGGTPEPPERHVQFFRQKGQIRKRPLTPGNSPIEILHRAEGIIDRQYEQQEAKHVKRLLANQSINLLYSVYGREIDSHLDAFTPLDRWEKVKPEISKLDVRWNTDKMRYTFRDGTFIADPIRKLYRRHIWNADIPSGEVELTVERRNKGYVHVTIRWEGKNNQKWPDFLLQAFSGKDKLRELDERKPRILDSRAYPTSNMSTYMDVKLAEGKELQLGIIAGDQERKSPIYTP